MRFGNYGVYLKTRWDVLGGEAATEAVRQKTGARTEADMPWGRNDELAQDFANQFKAAQMPIFVRIAGELHHTHGNRDVGLGSKSGGNNWQTPNGPIATDVIVLKDLDGSDAVQLVDCFSSMGGPETKPSWNEIEPNADRTFVVPPKPAAVSTDTGGTDTTDGETSGSSGVDAAVEALVERVTKPLKDAIYRQGSEIAALRDKVEAGGGGHAVMPTKIALRDSRGNYISADQDRSNTPLLANRKTRGPWEEFDFEVVR